MSNSPCNNLSYDNYAFLNKIPNFEIKRKMSRKNIQSSFKTMTLLYMYNSYKFAFICRPRYGGSTCQGEEVMAMLCNIQVCTITIM